MDLRRPVRRTALVVDMDANPPSSAFLKTLGLVLNSLSAEISDCRQAKNEVLKVGIVFPYEFFPHKVESRWLEHFAEMSSIQNQVDDIASLLHRPKCSSLATQLEQLFATDVIDSANIIEIVWLTTGSICSETDEELNFWKVGRKLSKNPKTAIRIVCEPHLINSDYVLRWRDRLSGEVIACDTQPCPTGLVSDSEVLSLQRILCNDVRWRGIVRCVSNPSMDNKKSRQQIRSRLRTDCRSSQLSSKSHQSLFNCGMEIVVLKGFNMDIPLAMYSTQTLILEAENMVDSDQSMKSFLKRFCHTSSLFLCRLEPIAVEKGMASGDSRCLLAVLRLCLTSSNVLLSFLSIDKDFCDPSAFNFLKTIFLPPNVRNCLTIVNLSDLFDQNSETPSQQKKSQLPDDKAADLTSYSVGYIAIQEIPSVQSAAESAEEQIGISLDSINNRPGFRKHNNAAAFVDKCSAQSSSTMLTGGMITPGRPSFQALHSPDPEAIQRSSTSASAAHSNTSPASLRNEMNIGYLGNSPSGAFKEQVDLRHLASPASQGISKKKRSLSKELRGISLSPNKNQKIKTNDAVGEDPLLVSASPLRSGRIRRAPSPTQVSTRTSESLPDPLGPSSEFNEIDTSNASTASLGGANSGIVGDASCVDVQLDPLCDSVKMDPLTSKAELEIFLSNLSRASDGYIEEGMALEAPSRSGRRLDGAALAKRVRLVQSGQSLPCRWRGSMKGETVIDYSAPYPYDYFGNKEFGLRVFSQRSGCQESVTVEGETESDPRLERAAEPPPSPTRKRHGEFQVSRHDRKTKLHSLLRRHPLLRNIMNPKEYASLFSDQHFDEIECIPQRQRRKDPEPRPMNSMATKFVKAGLASTRSSFLFSAPKPILERKIGGHRIDSKPNVRTDSKFRKQRGSRTAQGSKVESSLLHEQVQQAQTESGSAPDSMMDHTESSKSCPNIDTQFQSEIAFSVRESQESTGIVAGIEFEASKEKLGLPAFDHLSNDEKRALILNIAETLPLSAANLAGISANLLFSCAGAEKID